MEIDFSKIPSPCFVLDERLLRKNLNVIADVQRRAGVEIILALKACAMWSIFSEIRQYVFGATASSAAEARLVAEEFGTPAHTYAPTYTDQSFSEILRHSNHLTFNSVAQFERFGARAIERGVSCGLRVNPGYSPVATALYNPASPGSRLGIAPESLTAIPEGVEGLHFHVLCESGAEDLADVLTAFETRFGHLLPYVKWINMGGGHLMTREDYDRDRLVEILTGFRVRYPHLRVILEPGSAFTWRTGWLVATVEDVVMSGGVHTAMLDVSFACHMPDCLEMPYKPAIVGTRDPRPGDTPWRMGGNSCLAGDFMGDWAFPEGDPKVGQRIVFEDMIHYTMVKTTMFNGVQHPSIGIVGLDGEFRLVRDFGYEDFKNRMS